MFYYGKAIGFDRKFANTDTFSMYFDEFDSLAATQSFVFFFRKKKISLLTVQWTISLLWPHPVKLCASHRCNLQFLDDKMQKYILNEFQRFIYTSFLLSCIFRMLNSIRLIVVSHYFLMFENPLIVLHFIFCFVCGSRAMRLYHQVRFTISLHSNAMHLQVNRIWMFRHLTHLSPPLSLSFRHKSTYSIYLSLLSISCYNWLSSSLNKLRCFIMREKSIGKETDGDDDDDDYRWRSLSEKLSIHVTVFISRTKNKWQCYRCLHLSVQGKASCESILHS